MEFFSKLILYPQDPIFGLQQEIQKDPRPNLINLTVGIYQNEQLQPAILPSVKEAEKLLVDQENSKTYLPIGGDKEYIQRCLELVFGEDIQKCLGVQTVGATGALAIGGALLKACGHPTIGISSPSWVNHHQIFRHAGFEIHEYPYFSYEKKEVDEHSLLTALSHLPKHSVLLLQPSCHNPSGNDLNQAQWNLIAKIVKENALFPFFDCAYQGFGKGLDEDVMAIRSFKSQGIPFAVSLSHSKNFGLYSERVGALLIHHPEENCSDEILSNLKHLARATYSNPPSHGIRIVNTIMKDTSLRAQWVQEVNTMRARITKMRLHLCEALSIQFGSQDHPFEFLKKQVGMFSYTGLNSQKVMELRQKYAIYLPMTGRINVAGMNEENIPFIAKAMKEVFENGENSHENAHA